MTSPPSQQSCHYGEQTEVVMMETRLSKFRKDDTGSIGEEDESDHNDDLASTSCPESENCESSSSKKLTPMAFGHQGTTPSFLRIAGLDGPSNESVKPTKRQSHQTDGYIKMVDTHRREEATIS
ncbi:hypothetical protein K469DRAFT_696324 [Zopfia rhizophila CBS 207.26]|uniref:Uncharacterized protein n=1 Tax=Zopfia rhizophila CBS 207.26 TaxID=1314779 RepID=A0A6A6DEN5_9PEZI|nr:hypothetical protein K469DRAFT_696324 [Zopfia rhizophila CBS 207.26]